MKEYWNNRFIREGHIWGRQPSKTVIDAKRIFALNSVNIVLVPGAGYGRNTKILSESFQVDAIEISSEAVLLRRQWDTRSCFIEGSIFGLSSNSIVIIRYIDSYCLLIKRLQL
ncbi:hypothetical protein J41TS12_16760 [Paenibacillus antibioticophila]|uniref:Class I SAM-dependent methyltransferase n=1 Tax=Paenibacillus antibioticophila TaxID=1274374 RepID=A0A919XUU8_9BACL|nr:hypothetical protein [Paenibacillus antibioticophila]GIO36815.1 hypothetical protein J41TS12_16760 [Paenibacillus antibioticophila]